ncbi:MAG: hypothetical protein K6E13_09590 [Lachnospiraceae bacterium]|nr:hypothetical protein [Lachnospiraceae bacterium]
MKKKALNKILISAMAVAIMLTSVVIEPITAQANMKPKQFLKAHPECTLTLAEVKKHVTKEGYVQPYLDPDYDPYYNCNYKKQVKKITKKNQEGSFVDDAGAVVSYQDQMYTLRDYEQRRQGYRKKLKLSKTKVSIKKNSKKTVKISLTKNQLYMKTISATTDDSDIATVSVNKNTGKITIKTKKPYYTQDYSKYGVYNLKNYCYITVKVGGKFNIIRVTIPTNKVKSYVVYNGVKIKSLK